MNFKYFLSIFFLGFFLVITSNSSATIVSGTLTGGSAFNNGGIFQKLTPPIGDVGNNNFESNNLFAFNERQNYTLLNSLNVDIGSALLISSGTQVSSHYIFFDPSQRRRAIGTVVFDSDILGIVTTTTNLTDSDFLGNPAANYVNTGARSLENADSVDIDGINPRQLNVNFRASSPGDYVRVITEFSPTAVPEPATLLLTGLGLAGFSLRRFRK